MKRLYIILLLLCLKENLYSQNLNSNYVDNTCLFIELLLLFDFIYKKHYFV